MKRRFAIRTNKMSIPGARHLYLLDFSPENLPDLKSTIGKSYSDVKVGVYGSLLGSRLIVRTRLPLSKQMQRMRLQSQLCANKP